MNIAGTTALFRALPEELPVFPQISCNNSNKAKGNLTLASCETATHCTITLCLKETISHQCNVSHLTVATVTRDLRVRTLPPHLHSILSIIVTPPAVSASGKSCYCPQRNYSNPSWTQIFTFLCEIFVKN